MNDINFARNLTKGKIAETIFWMMFREDDRFILLPFGYEYTIPELTHYRKYLKDSIKTVEKISSSPDFIMLSSDKSQIYIVDVKYRTTLSDRLKLDAEKTLEKWEECYYFVATPEGFYFDTCKSIVQNNGKISSLSDTLVSKDIQEGYVRLLDEFMNIKTSISTQPVRTTSKIQPKNYWCPDCSEYPVSPIDNICPECGGFLVEM